MIIMSINGKSQSAIYDRILITVHLAQTPDTVLLYILL